MSSAQIDAMRAAAEDAKKQKNWEEACEKYSELLKEEFHDDDEQFPLQVCKDLIEYAYCILQEDEPELEVAWECLMNAKHGLKQMPEADVPPTSLADVYDFLGEIGMKNGAYEEAAVQYDQIISIAEKHPELSWRIGLSAFYTKTICLEAAEKFDKAVEAANKAIEFADAEKQKEQNAKDIQTIEDFKASIITKRDAIAAKVQAA